MRELEIIQHRQIEGLSIFFDTVDYRTPHVHPEWELIWDLENALSVTVGTQNYLLQPGEMILLNPDEPHEFHKQGHSATFLCLQVSPAVLPKILPVHVDGRLLHRHLSREEMCRLRMLLQQITEAYLQKADHFGLLCVGKGCEILHLLLTRLPSHLRTQEEAESIDKRNARMKRLIRYVDENYMNKICLADFAAAEGCSLGYMSRFIKNTMNLSFQEYVTSVRFNCACKLIAAGEMKLLDVCMESGFSDYRYFSREFRRQYGMTPQMYRKHQNRINITSTAVRHSLHSVERFYSEAESQILAEKYF